MDFNQLSPIRLAKQQLSTPQFRSEAALVSWMGAMQAQDFPMSKWAVGIRVPDSTERTVEEAINRGELIRTHVLRPTWHLVAAEDVVWMLELTGPRIKATMRSHDLALGITESVCRKSNALLEKALANGQHLSRGELVERFVAAGFAVDDNRAAHLLMRAEADGLIGSGRLIKGKPSYALLAERVANPKRFSREEALAELALRYFKSHGPATLADFNWWSGLTAADARLALESVKDRLRSEIVGDDTYWLDSETPVLQTTGDGVHLLPAFDEFIISYKNRAASLVDEHHKKAVSSNGIFRPVMVHQGMVAGTWRRSLKAKQAVFEPTYFGPVSAKLEQAFAEAFQAYIRFGSASEI